MREEGRDVPGVGALVVIEGALVVLGGRHGLDVGAIREAEQGALLTLLGHHPPRDGIRDALQ